MVARLNASASVAARAGGAGPALKSRPFGTLYYYVEMKSLTQAVFAECSALQIETEVYEYKEGGNNTHIHRLPGRAKVGNITLKRGIARPTSQPAAGPWANELWLWYGKILRGTIERHNLSIILFDITRGESVARWNIIGAYPVKWIGPALKAGESTVAIETLELAHAGVMLD
jgi:phage tail-like protein